MGTNTTWNFALSQRIMLPAVYNTTLLLTNFGSLPATGLPSNMTLVRMLYEPASSLPFFPPWDGNWTALYIREDLSALITAPSYWRTKYTSASCLWWRDNKLSTPDGDDMWARVLCGGYGGNIGRRGSPIGSGFIVWDPDSEEFVTVSRPERTNGIPTLAHIGTLEQAELWPVHVRVKNEFGKDVNEEKPCVRFLGTVTCWEP